MPKVLIIQPFHEDGMKLFEARPDVDYEVVDGALDELVEKIADADGVTIRTTPLPAEAHPRLVFESLFGEGGSKGDRRATLRRRAGPVTFIERIGARTIVHFGEGTRAVRAVFDNDVGLGIGQTAMVAPNPASVRVFDAASGNAIEGR